MHLQKVSVKNFRLLSDIELVLEEQTTLIVGRNNSGKTSLSEIIRRFLLDSSPKFYIEDFSCACYDNFCNALRAKQEGQNDAQIRDLLPCIELRLIFRYELEQPQLGPLSDFIIDLDSTCNEAVAVARYELADGRIEELFEGQPAGELTEQARQLFFRVLKERIPTMFIPKVWAEDPRDSTNRKPMSIAALRSLLRTGFINAQRGIDDTTTKETDVLAKVLEGLFSSASSPTAAASDQQIAQALEEAVREIQVKIDKEFNIRLKDLIPTLETFGYPGLGGPEIATETILDVKRLLSNHTKVRYTGHSGILLPESYNGLGVRNLIFILLQIVSFYRAFRAEASAPGVQLVFVEEPEAHLHPQMQEVFIRQLAKIAEQLNAQAGAGIPWPVQFVVSTHSSHVANAAGFESIRYFLSASKIGFSGVRHTTIKDLREGLRDTKTDHKKFLHQYLTLTRCDLFFADKAILIEGTSERLLLPVMIRKLEVTQPDSPKLSSQYMTIMEVGGSYAHLFFELLDFLEVRTLIITDLDSIKEAGGKACPVHEGTATSNACIKNWFSDTDCTPAVLLAKSELEKIRNFKRIAYQRPESVGGPCGRTFEDAFMLANAVMSNIQGSKAEEQEQSAENLAEKVKKSEFALKYAIDNTDWITPGYILDGLKWLAVVEVPPPADRLISDRPSVDAVPASMNEPHE